MANLIVKDEGPDAKVAVEYWYDFNPDDRETVRKIEALLTRGGPVDREARNRQLAVLCEESFKKKPGEWKIGRLAGILQTVRTQLSGIINEKLVSIYKNILFGFRTHARKQFHRDELDAMVERALKDVRLWDDVKDMLKLKATLLQLEQQQKLCIARLLPLKPDIILMDEPCSSLDVAGTHAIEELMFSLRGSYTIIIVTHNMAPARRASDECAFMLLGELIEHARTEDLFITPRNPKTAEYIEGRYG